MGIATAEIVASLRAMADKIEAIANRMSEPDDIVAKQPKNSPSWEVLDLDARASKCLATCCESNGRRLQTIHDVAALNEIILLETKNCGHATLSLIQEALSKHGLKLGKPTLENGRWR